MKTCYKCREEKTLDSFYKDSRAKDGRQSACKPCQHENDRDWNKKNPEKAAAIAKRSNRKGKLKRIFGLTVEDYEKLLTEQGGSCKICGGINQSQKRLAVDHCHTTKKIRGLLCHKCNRGLGLFNDSPDHLLAAMEYLLTSKLG